MAPAYIHALCTCNVLTPNYNLYHCQVDFCSLPMLLHCTNVNRITLSVPKWPWFLDLIHCHKQSPRQSMPTFIFLFDIFLFDSNVPSGWGHIETPVWRKPQNPSSFFIFLPFCFLVKSVRIKWAEKVK